MKREMYIQLTAVSPIAFSLAAPGDRLRIESKAPRKNEYREKIGPPKSCYLVFKGQTKIGMIPQKIAQTSHEFLKVGTCRVKEMNESSALVIISLFIDADLIAI